MLSAVVTLTARLRACRHAAATHRIPSGQETDPNLQYSLLFTCSSDVTNQNKVVDRKKQSASAAAADTLSLPGSPIDDLRLALRMFDLIANEH